MAIKRCSWANEGLAHSLGNTAHGMSKVVALDAESQPLVELSIFGTFESIALTNTLKNLRGNITDKQHGLM